MSKRNEQPKTWAGRNRHQRLGVASSAQVWVGPVEISGASWASGPPFAVSRGRFLGPVFPPAWPFSWPRFLPAWPFSWLFSLRPRACLASGAFGPPRSLPFCFGSDSRLGSGPFVLLAGLPLGPLALPRPALCVRFRVGGFAFPGRVLVSGVSLVLVLPDASAPVRSCVRCCPNVLAR